jgi:hypothetical protein
MMQRVTLGMLGTFRLYTMYITVLVYSNFSETLAIEAKLPKHTMLANLTISDPPSLIWNRPPRHSILQ